VTDAGQVEIVRLGAEGDGVAETAGGPVFVPFALPGELWRETSGGWQRESESPERRAAPCRHFRRCGGCVAQHMSGELYARWKRGMLVEAFRHRGLKPEVEPLRPVSERSRRRAFLGVERHGSEVVIGFREEGSHTLVDIEECLVLEPAIVAALGAMKEIARLVMPDGEGGRLVVTGLDRGLDVSFDNGRKDLAPETRAAAARIAAGARFIRLTIAGEPVAELAPPVVTLAGVEVEPPQGAFLQAVPEAEALLIELVVGALPKRAKRAAQPFSGLGTFAFP
jgi:23S rRNA (uracil1939-C5)-methyltransferase